MTVPWRRERSILEKVIEEAVSCSPLNISFFNGSTHHLFCSIADHSSLLLLAVDAHTLTAGYTAIPAVERCATLLTANDNYVFPTLQRVLFFCAEHLRPFCKFTANTNLSFGVTLQTIRVLPLPQPSLEMFRSTPIHCFNVSCQRSLQLF